MSSCSGETVYSTYCEDPDGAADILEQSDDWKDIEPIEQNEAENAVVPVDYSNTYDDAVNVVMGYFRAIMHKNERSIRALWLTGAAIELNMGNYTAWYYRRLCLEAIDDVDLNKELDLVADLGGANPKVYQLWYHRRELAEILGELSLHKELKYTENVFEADPKNYHAWAHRQYLLKVFLKETDTRWDHELEFCKKIIDEDVRNNSAWNHRYFVNSRGGKRNLATASREAELYYSLEKLRLTINNESVWNYMRGMLDDADISQLSKDCISTLTGFINSENCQNSTLGLAFYVDWNLNYCPDTPGAKEAARKSIILLRDTKDPTRSGYWSYRLSLLSE